MSSPGSSRHQPGRAALWMIGAIVAFSSMAVSGRAVSAELDTFETMMYRSFIGVIVVVSGAAILGRLRDIAPRRLGLHLLRNTCHFTGQNLWFAALTLIPLAQLFALEFTSPIWVMVLAVLILGERVTKVRITAIALGFAGALIVAQPGTGGDPLGLALAAASALGFAGSIVLTKVLTETETTVSILFWLTIMQSVMGMIAAGFDGEVALPSLSILPFVVAIGVAGIVAHLCLTQALSIAPAIIVVPMDFLRLPAIAIVGAIFYAEPLNMAVFLGAGLILAANMINLTSQGKSDTDL